MLKKGVMGWITQGVWPLGPATAAPDGETAVQLSLAWPLLLEPFLSFAWRDRMMASAA
jgi:hypothetical protein